MSSSLSKFQCAICGKVFASTSNLGKHNRIKHEHIRTPEAGAASGFDKHLFRCLEGCEISFTHSEYLEDHLSSQHDFHVDKHNLEFSTFEEFQIWLQNLQTSENIKFYRPGGKRKSTCGSYEKYSFACSRSGKKRRVPDELLKRRRRSYLISDTSEFMCTSRIIVKQDILTSKCDVWYCSTHYGHTEEMPRPPPKRRRKKKEIAPSPPSPDISLPDSTQDLEVEIDYWDDGDVTTNDQTFVDVNAINHIKYFRKTTAEDWKNNIMSQLLQLHENLSNLHYTEDEFQYIYKQLKMLNNLGSVSSPKNSFNPPSPTDVLVLANKQIEESIEEDMNVEIPVREEASFVQVVSLNTKRKNSEPDVSKKKVIHELLPQSFQMMS